MNFCVISFCLSVAVARTCSLILIVLDVLKPLQHKRIIEKEVEGFGIRYVYIGETGASCNAFKKHEFVLCRPFFVPPCVLFGHWLFRYIVSQIWLVLDFL